MVDSSRSLIESYLLEITARARSAQERCESLLAFDFVSDSPRDLARAISKMCSFLEGAAVSIFKQIDWDDPDQLSQDLWLLRNTDILIQQLAAHLRYVQGSRSDRLPWGIIPSLERLVKQLVPDIQIMLRPKWNYNYSLVLADFREYYRTALEELVDYLPGIDLDSDILADLQCPFHVIAFPSLERENILLHTLLGHEIGHLFAHRFLSEERKNEFKASVIEQIEIITDQELDRGGISEDKTGPLFWPEIKKASIAQNTVLAMKYWIRAVEEILSDMVGAVLFGPAALFSTLEIAMQHRYDIAPSPSNNFYPPWRRRLRAVLKVVEQESFFPIPALVFAGSIDRARRANERFETIKAICREKEDDISGQPIARLAYERLDASLAEGLSFVLNDCGLGKRGRQAKPRQLYRNVSHLIARLDHDLPPNAIEASINDRGPVSLVEIINASWFHRVSLGDSVLTNTGELDERVVRQRRTANRLTLKAIEFAGLSAEFWRENRVSAFQASPAGSEIADGNSGSVPAALDLVNLMQEPALDKRLVVTPLLNPSETIGAGSIDVRLGNQFIVMKRESFPLLDIGQPHTDRLSMERYQERTIKSYGEKFILHPRQLVIGSTLEYIQIPPGLMCYVIGKSTWGRMGLVIATATKVDTGFRGCITLEIINEGEIPLVLYPGIPIAQLVFHRSASGDVYRGGYSCAIGPEFPKFEGKRESWMYWTRLPGTKKQPS